MNETDIITLVIPAMISALAAIISAIIAGLTRRDNNRMKVRLAEIEADRDETARDAATTSGALTLASTVVTTFEPVKQTLENMAKIVGDLVQVTREMIERADKMHEVTERRDREIADDRRLRDDNQRVIIERLDAQQRAMGEITKQITVATDENTLRHEIAKLLLLNHEMLLGIKALRPPQSEPGETRPVEQEAGPELSEKTEKDKENVATTP